MVFTLPGAGGGGDMGGDGDSWDRNEGDGDWGEASDEQMERVKRLVAAKEKSEVNLEDLEVSDVEADEELFDKKTGKKLTFTFPDAPLGFASAGRGRGKGNGRGKSRGKKKSEKNEERGEKEKGNEPKGEKEKNSTEKEIIDEAKEEDPKEDDDHEQKGEKEKNPQPKDQNNYEPKGEKEKNSPGYNEQDVDSNDEKENEMKGEKSKNPTGEFERNEDDDDCFDLNLEDMEVVHVYPVKKGGPPPYQKCQYELIRDQIIADREALMREVLADIQKSSREIVEENEKCKKRKAIDDGKGKKEKKRKVERVVDTGGARRSARERKPVNYCAVEDVDDPDWEPGQKKKKVERKRKRRDGSNDHIRDRKPLPPDWKPYYHHLNNPFERQDGGDGAGTSSSAKNDNDKNADSAERGGRSMRARKFVNYNFDGPRADEFVFCERCGEDKYHGCEIHPLIFDYVAHFDVGPSKVGKNAGRGVFNNDFRGDIPEGVMFGPYDGIFYTPKEYKHLKKTRGESGYAWELRDPDKIKVIGYVDPGPNPNPLKQWMSIVNCASKTRHQNLMPGQFIGGIYYRSMEIIHFGEELLVYYGNDYARDIKIKVEERDFYELYEDWEEEGVSCPHCGQGFVKQEFLQKHIDLVETSSGGCKEVRREKNRAEVLAGLRPHICGECGMGFKTAWDLNQHKATHSDAKPFVCPECGKAFKSSQGLTYHVKGDHEGQTYDCPDCERPFKQKQNMMNHWKNVCCREDQEFKCPQCGKKFNQNGNLTKHIKAVHNRELPHKCEDCGKRFGQKITLQRHILGVHENARPYVCKDCCATFKSAQDLDHHRIKKHTLQWYWNCDVCDAKKIEMGFLKPCDLKKHMIAEHPQEYKKQIEEEKPAVCPKCQKRFPSEEQVAIHLKKMHNNE